MSATDPDGTVQPGAGDPGATAHPPGYTPPPGSPRTNAMAVVSMVCSILGLTLVPFVGSIIGVVTGHIARRQIRESGEQGLGPANAGVAIGWVGVVIGLLLVAVLVVIVVAAWRSST